MKCLQDMIDNGVEVYCECKVKIAIQNATEEMIKGVIPKVEENFLNAYVEDKNVCKEDTPVAKIEFVGMQKDNGTDYAVLTGSIQFYKSFEVEEDLGEISISTLYTLEDMEVDAEEKLEGSFYSVGIDTERAKVETLESYIEDVSDLRKNLQEKYDRISESCSKSNLFDHIDYDR